MKGETVMLLVDREIKQLIDDNVLVGADINNISNICYDLCSSRFFSSDTKMMTSCDLMPGETVFVESRERIHLKNDMIAKIVLRNSRIRQGLSLEAPIYQPGHYTKIYFRITNISKCKINLDTNNGIASIMFEKLSHDVDRPYHGTFQDEFNFSGMGDYESSYRSAMQDLEHKADEVKNIEKKLYSNVINLMVYLLAFSV